MFFFFNDTATTEIYTLSLHDALPIFGTNGHIGFNEPARELQPRTHRVALLPETKRNNAALRSEEHTSELQSRQYLVCRLLLEKKKQTGNDNLIRRHD